MKIIIPTDLTESTLKALNFLSSFKKTPTIHVDLLFVDDNKEIKDNRIERKEWNSRKIELKSLLKEQILIIDTFFSNYNFAKCLILRKGNLEKEILKIASSGDYEILLSATHGLDSLRDIVFGNVTQHLVNESLIPVLSLPENYRISESNRLLLVNDFAPGQKINFNFLRHLTEVFKLELHVLKIVDELNENENEVAIKSDIISYMNSNQLKYDQLHIKEARTIEEGVHHFLEEFDISICAMATHARHGIKHFLLGSIAEKLVDSINVPLFTFRTQAQ